MPRSCMRSSLSTSTPPSAMAPMASSGCPGTPSLRTRNTSRGTWSSRATSYPTGTPPRGRARTTTSERPPYAISGFASCRPASARSRKPVISLLRSAGSNSSRQYVRLSRILVRLDVVPPHPGIVAQLALCGVKGLAKRERGVLARHGFAASPLASRFAVRPDQMQARRLTGDDLLARHGDVDAHMEAIPLLVMTMGDFHEHFARDDVRANLRQLGGTLLDLSIQPLAARHRAIGNVSRESHRYLDFRNSLWLRPPTFQLSE